MARRYPDGQQHRKGKKRNRGAHKGSDAAVKWLKETRHWPKPLSNEIDLSLGQPQKLRRVANQNRGDAV